jgi:hypothetical protein
MAVTGINLLAEISGYFRKSFDAQMQLMLFDNSKVEIYKVGGQNCLCH